MPPPRNWPAVGIFFYFLLRSLHSLDKKFLKIPPSASSRLRHLIIQARDRIYTNIKKFKIRYPLYRIDVKFDLNSGPQPPAVIVIHRRAMFFRDLFARGVFTTTDNDG